MPDRPEQKKQRKALGLTDEDIERRAQITDSDVDRARAWNRTYMPAPFDGLAEAEPWDDDLLTNGEEE